MPLPLPSPLVPPPSSSTDQIFPTPTSTKHKPRMSGGSDFGSFHNAGPLSAWEHVEEDAGHPLGEHDLLGSFEELSTGESRSSTPKLLSTDFTDQAQARTAQRQADLLGEIDDLIHHEEDVAAATVHPVVPSQHVPHWSPFPPHGPQKFPVNKKQPSPITIPTPSDPTSSSSSSRPVPPPLRSPPRRMSQVLSSRPPLSPPLVSAGTAENDLLWQSPSKLGPSDDPTPSFGEADDSMKQWRKTPSTGESSASSVNVSSSTVQMRPQPSSPSRDSSRSLRGTPPSSASSLLNTLATTTKLASKWKTVLGPSTFTSPAPGSSADLMDNAPTPTSLPTNINHSTPFAHRPGSFHSYIPPSGAPGFRGDDEEKRALEWIQRERASVQHPEWINTKLLGRRSETRVVLDQAGADALRPSLPPRQRLATKWNLLFSLDQHGASLATMYRLIENYADSYPNASNLLMVKDADDQRFGVYLNQAIKKVEGSYYGSGESFLYKLIEKPGEGVEAKVFKWTGRNQYFALCESGFISFGGGGGTFGLILDSTFSSCSSARSPAYDNEVLCVKGAANLDKTVRFECIGLEVWGT